MEATELLHSIYVKLGDLAVFCLFVNVVFCLFNFKQFNKSLQFFSYFLIWNLLIECSARICSYSGLNNLPLLHLYTLGEFLFVSFFYKSLIHKPSFFQNHFRTLIISGATLIMLNSLFIQPILEFNTIAKTSVQIIIISYAVLYFYNLTESHNLSNTTEKSLRLINSAVIIYYSGSFFVFMCGQFSFESSALYKIFWAFNAALNLIFQLLILWEIWRVIFRKTPSSL